MLIHTVAPGEQLEDVGARYGTSTREIIHLNELQSRTRIVPGLHLIIPGPATLTQEYTVKSGDSLDTIGKRAGVPADELAGWLGIQKGGRLRPGQKLYVPRRVQSRRAIEVNGFLIPEGTASDSRVIQDVAQRLTYVSIFSYQVRADGTLIGQRDTNALSATRQLRVAPLMTVTNYDGNSFNTELAHTIMANSSIRKKIIEAVGRMAKSRGFRGVVLDFEHLRPTDRSLYTQFVTELGESLRKQGLAFAIVLGPKTSDDATDSATGAYDYKALAEQVDFVVLMTYEWGWVGGPPLAGILLHVSTNETTGLYGFVGCSVLGSKVYPHRPSICLMSSIHCGGNTIIGSCCLLPPVFRTRISAFFPLLSAIHMSPRSRLALVQISQPECTCGR